MYDLGTRTRALDLLRSGATNTSTAREMGIPVGTISYWRHMDRAKRGDLPGRGGGDCPRCSGHLNRAAYAYLLGLYLGDGHIIHYRKHGAPSLMIACDDNWPGLLDACEAAIRAVLPRNRVCRVQRKGCQNVKVYSRHLLCLFPQHGPGKKHDRLITLAPWQQDIVDAHPWEFIRGLVHSDGSRITNWATRTVAGVRKRYEYPRYFFTNTSADILRLFTDTLDKVGVQWKRTVHRRAAQNVSIARRDSVALMDQHIGPKY